MNAPSELAEALATSRVLRATARVFRDEQSPLSYRLNRAADALDGVAALAVRCLKHIKQLEQELRKLRAGGP